ncbi:hypothetical protein [Ochrobactrum chromiisoli]|uniref:Tetratricopeptide repeat protein n=1 Tax=Ochrobactrum chromiisoli TaxID=2993941 RepID=A0ABT3QP48_9HYPH|nr:hypothetical protein [Ochrobactrum chromiisoli]MCX2697380.1 hypothetical protein [Ochrobactrum chromiisoli]
MAIRQVTTENGRWPLLIVVLTVILLSLLSVSSRYLETRHTNLLLSAPAINVEAVLSYSSRVIASTNSDAQLEEVEQLLRSAIPFNSGDARIYSLLGEIARRKGQSSIEVQMFGHALTLAPTEKFALLWSIQRAVIESDFDTASKKLDLLFRRWPDEIKRLASVIPTLFQSPDAFEIFSEKLSAGPPWRRALINVMSEETSPNKAFTAQLLTELASGRNPPTTEDTRTILASLFKEKAYDLAYQTFLFTLPPDERRLSGYIFDAEFEAASENRIFGWQIRQQPGAKITIPAKQKGALIEFANTPIIRLGLQQTLKLPPGSFSLEYSVSATRADMPKALIWNLMCSDPNKNILKSEVPQGDYNDRVIRASFNISEGCHVQTLSLRTTAMVESWNDRYSGQVRFNYIRIIKE